MNEHDSIAAPRQAISHPRYLVSVRLSDGALAETVFDPTAGRTIFCVFRDGEPHYEEQITDANQIIVPYTARNNLIRHDVVRFSSRADNFESEASLIAEIRAFIHQFVDVSPLFEAIASYYVLLSWVYDSFNELPYLRVIGEPGSGKTRFLLTVGSICYKPIFASGASSVSPIFRILHAFQGTLVIDEGDFRASDEHAEIVKILNNGHARGFPVLRSELSPTGEYNPRAYRVFGPKLVATRGFFQDRALESRCITEELGQRRLRDDIPINLPPSHGMRALSLRNKLLTFRFKNVGKRHIVDSLVDRTIEPRLNQVFVPLLSLVEDASVRAELQELARRYHGEIIAERGMDSEAQILEIIRDMLAQNAPLAIKDISDWFSDRHGDEYERKVTAKWIGWIIRKRLRLGTQKRHGVYVIADGSVAKLERLFDRYGINKEEVGVPPSVTPPNGLPQPHELPGS
ncbi:MAG TPA: hypothetical protein VFV19_18770 [Candidatus Polarisedimenticolaceae bacterium]|nr:hypothetical protein [Candidatus Polarisedimenticolaceae bacterium]